MKEEYVYPKYWGPHFWFMMRCIAYNYPESPSLEDAEFTRNFYNNFKFTLPCAKCQASYRYHLREFPVEKALRNREILMEWVEVLYLETKKIIDQVKNEDMDKEFKKRNRILVNKVEEKPKELIIHKDLAAQYSSKKNVVYKNFPQIQPEVTRELKIEEPAFKLNKKTDVIVIKKEEKAPKLIKTIPDPIKKPEETIFTVEYKTNNATVIEDDNNFEELTNESTNESSNELISELTSEQSISNVFEIKSINDAVIDADVCYTKCDNIKKSILLFDGLNEYDYNVQFSTKNIKTIHKQTIHNNVKAEKPKEQLVEALPDHGFVRSVKNIPILNKKQIGNTEHNTASTEDSLIVSFASKQGIAKQIVNKSITIEQPVMQKPDVTKSTKINTKGNIKLNAKIDTAKVNKHMKEAALIEAKKLLINQQTNKIQKNKNIEKTTKVNIPVFDNKNIQYKRTEYKKEQPDTAVLTPVLTPMAMPITPVAAPPPIIFNNNYKKDKSTKLSIPEVKKDVLAAKPTNNISKAIIHPTAEQIFKDMKFTRKNGDANVMKMCNCT